MKPNVSIYLLSIQYNGITWDATNGGPQNLNYDYGGVNLPFRSSNDIFPVFNPVIDKDFGITFELSEFHEEIKSGKKSDMVVIIQKPDETTISATYKNMIFVGCTGTQPRGNYATRTLRFVYEAAEGAQGPQEGSQGAEGPLN
jgi:hypothetical protein